MEILLKAIYFMFPVYFANMAPVIYKKIPFLAYPLDLGKKFKNKRIFDSHKTFRGLFFGVLAGMILAYIQFQLSGFEFFDNISVINYSNWIMIGGLMGFGAIAGDAVESFFKRQRGIRAGERWIPFDQLDFVIGGLVSVSFYKFPFYFPGPPRLRRAPR